MINEIIKNMSINESYIFGVWCGDGCKTTNMLQISRGNDQYLINSMEKISLMLNTTCKHDSPSFTTTFHKQKVLLDKFKILYDNILFDYESIEFDDEKMFAFISGFLDSDGSVELPDSNNNNNLSKNKISINFYNNKINLLYFIKKFLSKYGINSKICDSTYKKGNLSNVVDRCFKLCVGRVLDNYLLGFKLSKFVLNDNKIKRILNFIESYDNYYSTISLNITEIFYSIEGEGCTIGEPKVFVRVYGCPFECTYCDSRYSISKNRNIVPKYGMQIKDVINKIKEFPFFNHIEFTGGSPDWFADKVGYLLIYFKSRYDSKITMQVSGGLFNDKIKRLFDHSTINCFDYKDPREKIPFLIPNDYLRSSDEIKFLVSDDWSYEWVKEKINHLRNEGVQSTFIITGLTENDIDDDIAKNNHINQFKKLVEKILSDKSFNTENVRILPRLHILIWGNKKGV